jgi:hypothetical protein
MATTTPLSYNITAPISGTTQFGNLAVGTTYQQYSTNPGGVTWWMGPDQEIGYVIAVPVSGDTQPTNIPGVTASVGFFQTPSLDDTQFINLAQDVSNQYGNPQTFVAASQASLWLTSNGFWNTYGNWQFSDTYTDATGFNGEITFPNHNGGVGDPNPNDVGYFNNSGGTATQIYINAKNTAGSDGNLFELQGNYGSLTLSQGSNCVTYSFTDEAFFVGSDEAAMDYYYGSSTPGSLCVTSFASGDFNTTQSINISKLIYPSGYSFTITSSMLNFLNSAGQPQYGSPNGTTGFTVANQIDVLLHGVYGGLNDNTEISNAFNSVGATSDFNGYIVLAQWGAGSDYQSGLAKIAWDSFNNQFFVTSVDGINSTFTQQYNNNGLNLPGTFNFPAKFTFITPLIHKADWC